MRAELARVTAARLEMEFRIEELSESIARVRQDIIIQENKEQELTIKLKEMEN